MYNPTPCPASLQWVLHGHQKNALHIEIDLATHAVPRSLSFNWWCLLEFVRYSYPFQERVDPLGERFLLDVLPFSGQLLPLLLVARLSHPHCVTTLQQLWRLFCSCNYSCIEHRTSFRSSWKVSFLLFKLQYTCLPTKKLTGVKKVNTSLLSKPVVATSVAPYTTQPGTVWHSDCRRD